MIFSAISKALGQISDPKFLRVLGIGVGLTILLLFGMYLVVVWGLDWLLPESFTLPWIGEITFVDSILSWASIALMLVLSVFLMVPVASAFTSLFLDDVMDAVEAKYYPALATAPRVGFVDGLRDSVTFLGVLIGANLVALVAYIMLAPFAPLIFISLNGFLLGREYFQLVALRRLGREGARQARARNAGTIWLTGAIMAAPLTIPVLNLFVPVLGAAAFTHLFHQLETDASGQTNPDRAL